MRGALVHDVFRENNVIVADRVSGDWKIDWVQKSQELVLGKCVRGGGGCSSQARSGPASCGKKAAVES
jgi:hypothetical protein